jgi:hypothetical protein
LEELHAPPSEHEPESIYAAVTRWATHAPPQALTITSILGLGGAITVLLLDWHQWALAGLLLTATTIGAWGLIEHKAAQPHSRLVALTEHLLAGLGCVLGFAAALGLLLGLLGPAPNH